eukprot:366024-Chlamydomonas_euryale.AAC.30
MRSTGCGRASTPRAARHRRSTWRPSTETLTPTCRWCADSCSACTHGTLMLGHGSVTGRVTLNWVPQHDPGTYSRSRVKTWKRRGRSGKRGQRRRKAERAHTSITQAEGGEGRLWEWGP